MSNDFLKFYGENNISPVRQNIDDFQLHLQRRAKLYRQCGVPVVAFKNVNILEVGPGSGYNTLVLFTWTPSTRGGESQCIDLVEANKRGISDMKNLFDSHKIDSKRYKIFESKIEDYQTEKKYDIIIAEGFLHFLDNQKQVIDKLKSLTADNGIIIITCADIIGLSIEIVKRLIGQILTAEVNDYKEKVQKLTEIFEPQLKKLRGVSRLTGDWVEDQLLNPASINGNELTFLQAIEMFGEGYDVLGSSPNMFTDYSWYKDVWFDYKLDYKKQYENKKISFFLAGTPEIKFDAETNNIISKSLREILRLEREFEKNFDKSILNSIFENMSVVNKYMNKIDERLSKVWSEAYETVHCLMLGKDIIFEKYPNFFSAFGRGQHYIAFQKNSTNRNQGVLNKSNARQ